MSERSPLLSATWHTPYNTPYHSDEEVTGRRSTGSQRPGSVTINVAFQDSSSDYYDYSTRIERTTHGTITPEAEIGVYASRWYLLLILSLSVTLQNAVWATWGPIAESAKAVYGWDTTMLTIVINCGNLGVLLPLLFTGYLISKKGLRVSMVICTFLLALGAGLRTISTKQTLGTVLIAAGQFCNGLAGSITQVIPPSLSETWFPSNERTTATAIGIVANSLGGLVGFTLGPNIVWDITNSSDSSNCQNVSQNHTICHKQEVDHISHQIWILTMIDFGVGAVLFVLTLVYFPAKPPKPPSQSAVAERVDFSSGLLNVFKQPLILLISLATAVPWAIFGNWMGLVNVNLHDIGISQHQSGLFGLYGSIGGIIGGTLIGRIADKVPRRLKRFIVVLFMFSLASILWITCMRNGYLPKSTVQFAIAITLMCAVMNGALPLCYEMACEVGYPIHEGIVGTFISLGINIAAVCFLLLELVPNIGVNWMNWTLVGVLGASICCLVALTEQYNRSDVDDEIEVRTQKDKLVA